MTPRRRGRPRAGHRSQEAPSSSRACRGGPGPPLFRPSFDFAQDEDGGRPTDCFAAAAFREIDLTPLIRPAAEPDLRPVAALIDRAVRISNAPEYDVHERLAVLQDYTLPALKRRLDRAAIFLVAEMPGMDKGPLGAVSAIDAGRPLAHERGMLIDTMFVDPSMQGMGLGGALLDAAVERARRQGVAIVTVAASLTAAPFYAHMGFSRFASSRSARGVATVMMERVLR